jgi:hypothetical protein
MLFTIRRRTQGFEFTTKAALKLELIQTQLAQKPVLRAEVFATRVRCAQVKTT